jgi:hypothetical protein
MRLRLLVMILVTATIAGVYVPDLSKSQAAEGTPARKEAAASLTRTLDVADSASDPEKEMSLFRSAAAKVRKMAPANVFVADIFQKIEQVQDSDSRKLAKQWRTALIEARDLLEFELVEESPLPEGFPGPTPVGEIRLQEYPEYRLARTEITLLEGSAFFTLFNHIKERDIEMTAPVEMTYGAEGKTAKTKRAMSFMYRNTRQGQPGTAGEVDVVDIPPQLAISIGIRGNATKERVVDGQRRLEEWVKEHRDEYEVAGPLRVMGYNSPFIPEKKQFAEIQIPVRTKQKSAD